MRATRKHHSQGLVAYAKGSFVTRMITIRTTQIAKWRIVGRRGPITANTRHAEAMVFTADNLLREARRPKGLATQRVPAVCVLDPDGDMGRLLPATGHARVLPVWVCYHADLLVFEHAGVEMGLIGCPVGASFAVLVAEELFATGYHLLISVTSAGQISDADGPPSYFLLIDQAWRNEGTNYHYLPPAQRSGLRPELRRMLHGIVAGATVRVHFGTTWTNDAPFRETPSPIRFYRERGVAAVKMEAAGLYAFAAARNKPVVCFAHVTNQMAMNEGDCEKGRDNGSHDVLEVIRLTAQAWLAASNADRSERNAERL